MAKNSFLFRRRTWDILAAILGVVILIYPTWMCVYILSVARIASRHDFLFGTILLTSGMGLALLSWGAAGRRTPLFIPGICVGLIMSGSMVMLYNAAAIGG